MQIDESAKKWGISPQTIGSVLFQENFLGLFGDLKNVGGAFKLLKGDYSYSMGLVEMQIDNAKRLLKQRGKAGTTFQAISWLLDEKLAIDLAAQYLRELSDQTGLSDPVELSKAYNLGVDNYLNGKYFYIGRRSSCYQNHIKRALEEQ